MYTLKVQTPLSFLSLHSEVSVLLAMYQHVLNDLLHHATLKAEPLEAGSLLSFVACWDDSSLGRALGQKNLAMCNPAAPRPVP